MLGVVSIRSLVRLCPAIPGWPHKLSAFRSDNSARVVGHLGFSEDPRIGSLSHRAVVPAVVVFTRTQIHGS